MEIFEEDEVYQNYSIEKNVLNSIDQVQETVLSREHKFYSIKYYLGTFLMALPLCVLAGIFTGGLAFIPLSFGVGYGSGYMMNKILNPKEKGQFLRNNFNIIEAIQGN